MIPAHMETRLVRFPTSGKVPWNELCETSRVTSDENVDSEGIVPEAPMLGIERVARPGPEARVENWPENEFPPRYRSWRRGKVVMLSSDPLNWFPASDLEKRSPEWGEKSLPTSE